jgi:hypothetical protein
MDRACCQFLAGSGLTLDEHRSIERRNLPNQRPDDAERW